MNIRCPNCNISQIFHKFDSNNFQIYFCQKCLNGFTFPVPKDISKYYNNSYWISKGFSGIFKDMIYQFFQARRKDWVVSLLKGGRILDVGSGEGIFAKKMKEEFNVTSIDTPSAKIKNPSVLKMDFMEFHPKNKFDAIVFWESLEHTVSPQKYISKAVSILKPGGYIFIEYPKSDSWEANIFRSRWFHLDPPRHLSHLTPEGINEILSRAKLTTMSHSGVPAFEYTVGGFVGSILNLVVSNPSNFLKNSKNLPFMVLLIPLVFIATFMEILFLILGQSPIYLTIAKKKV